VTRAVRQRLIVTLLCLACGWGSAQAVEFSAGGATVQFPGPQAQIQQVTDASGSLLHWQPAPTPQDSQRALFFYQLPQSFWANWLMRIAPEAMIGEVGNRLIADSQAASLKTKGHADAEDSEWVEVNGHPGLQLSTGPRDIRPPTPPPNDRQTPLLRDRKYVSTLVLWTGESMVMLAVGGNQPATDDAFLQSVRTATTVQPGDADAQWNLLCTIGGLTVPALLLLLIALVFVIDKSIKRRKRARMTAA
jgi:hypothetical protein